MKVFGRLGLRGRLLALVVTIASLGAMSGAVGLHGMRQVSGQVEQVAGVDMRLLSLVQAAHTVMVDAGQARANMILATDSADRAQRIKLFDQRMGQLAQLMEQAEPLLQSAEGRQLFGQAKAAVDDWVPQARQFVDLYKNKPFMLLEPDVVDGDRLTRAANDKVFVAFEQLVAERLAAADEAKKRAQATASRTTVISLVAIVAALISGLAIGTLTTRSVMRSLGATPVRLREMVQRVAAGDLAAQHDATGAAAGSVVADLDTMRDDLARIVLSIRQGTRVIAADLEEIVKRNGDLSARTEQQAASLEETAAAVMHIAEGVRTSAAHAQQASEMAGQACAAAEAGGTAVGQVVTTMAEIQSSSRKIVDITGVIDSIAFQTNILALNAAVEASRAGEHGSGFAVVAAEVRSLAQRSADSARQIKDLIAASVANIDAGGELVGHAGRSMADLVTRVGEVAALIAQISQASAELNTGVAEIASAMKLLDRATQQNASLVEHTAAACGNLSEEARRLDTAVVAFRIPGDVAPA